MKTRRIKKIKTRRIRKMKGGKVSKIDGLWKFDTHEKPMSTIPRVLTYQGLEIDVLNDLAAASTETNSNEYLKTTELEDEFIRRCGAEDITLQQYEALKVLKSNISQIIHLRTEEGFDKFDPFEDSEKKRTREGHEFRVNLWIKKYVIIKKALNEVRKKLNQKPETDIVFLAAQLGTLGKKKQLIQHELKKIVANIASIDADFAEAIQTLSQLQGTLSSIPTFDMTEKSTTLKEIFADATRQVEEVRRMVTDLIFKFRDPLFVAFNKALDNFSSKTSEQMTELSTLLTEFISYLESGSSKEIHKTREKAIRGILASIDQEEQDLQSDVKENAKEEDELIQWKESKDPEDVLQMVGKELREELPEVDLDAEVATRNREYIEVLNAIMDELLPRNQIEPLTALIDKTIKRDDIEPADKVTLVFFMRALLFNTCMDIVTLIIILSKNDRGGFRRKSLSEFSWIKDADLEITLKRFNGTESVESLILKVTQNIGVQGEDKIVRFYVFVYYLYQYLRVSPPILEALPTIKYIESIKETERNFNRDSYRETILQICLDFSKQITTHLPFFRTMADPPLTDTFLMREATEAKAANAEKEAKSKMAASEGDKPTPIENDKTIHDMEKETHSIKARITEMNEYTKSLIRPYDKHTQDKIIFTLQGLILTLMMLPEIDRPKEEERIIALEEEIIESAKLKVPISKDQLIIIEENITRTLALKRKIKSLENDIAKKRISDEKAKIFLGLLKQKIEKLSANLEKLKKTIDPSIVDRISKLYGDIQNGPEKAENERNQIELDALISHLKERFPGKLENIDDLTKNIADLFKTQKDHDIKKAKIDASTQPALPEGAEMKEGEGVGGSTKRKRPRKKTRRSKR